MTLQDFSNVDHPIPLTDFEIKINDAAIKIINEGKTGYAWKPVDELLSAEISSDTKIPLITRCKKASDSGRAANVLTESNDKDVDLYLIFVLPPYKVSSFVRVAENRISRFQRVRTVAIAEKVEGTWRVTKVVERDDTNLSANLISHFPLLNSQHIIKVQGAVTEPFPIAEVVQADEDVFASAARSIETTSDDLSSLPIGFQQFAEAESLQINLATATDLLACALSSQFVLFAGPSGTGKSRLASSLAKFLSNESSTAILEARGGWVCPEDAFGYYSSLTNRFAQTPDTLVLTSLHEASVGDLMQSHIDIDNVSAPVLIIEEANLSAIEGYLAPVTHGFSRPSVEYLRWNLHAQKTGASDTDELLDLPPTLLIGPWPRVFATINVDANSAAPSKKVTARAAVMLLEPDESFNVKNELKRLIKNLNKEDIETKPAHPRFLGNPETARNILSEDAQLILLDNFGSILNKASDPGELVPSKRDIERALNYMAYFVSLAGSENGDKHNQIVRIAAENAFAHTLLPQLSASQFTRAIQELSDTTLSSNVEEPGGLGGLLASRVRRLSNAVNDSLFAESIDFWTSLS